jgi:hypothetical protein
MSHEFIILNFDIEPFLTESAIESATGNALDILETACTRPPARAPDRPSSTR